MIMIENGNTKCGKNTSGTSSLTTGLIGLKNYVIFIKIEKKFYE